MGRKCEQLENLATAVESLAKPGDVIVDFCSGGVIFYKYFFYNLYRRLSP